MGSCIAIKVVQESPLLEQADANGAYLSARSSTGDDEPLNNSLVRGRE